jgi:hypothetical protein
VPEPATIGVVPVTLPEHGLVLKRTQLNALTISLVQAHHAHPERAPGQRHVEFGVVLWVDRAIRVDAHRLADTRSAAPNQAGMRALWAFASGVARAHETERCANAAVHTLGRAPDFRTTHLKETT